MKNRGLSPIVHWFYINRSMHKNKGGSMNKSIVLFLLIAQNVFVSGMAAEPFTLKSESSVSEQFDKRGIVRTTINTSFSFTKLYISQEDKFEDVLISKKIKRTLISGREGADSHIEVVAWIKGKSKYDTKMWTINDCADSGGLLLDFYKTTKYGCCGAEDIQRAFNIKTGKYVFSFTVDPVVAEIIIPKDRIERYIAYLSANATDTKCTKNNLPDSAIGSLTLTDGGTQIDRILIESNDKELNWSPKISLVNNKEVKGVSKLSIWPKVYSGKSGAVKDFSVKLFYYDGMEAIIPIKNDKFDISNSLLPKSIMVKRISIE